MSQDEDDDQILEGVRPDLTIDEIMNIDPDKLSREQRAVIISKMVEARQRHQIEAQAAAVRGGRTRAKAGLSPEAVKALLDDLVIE